MELENRPSINRIKRKIKLKTKKEQISEIPNVIDTELLLKKFPGIIQSIAIHTEEIISLLEKERNIISCQYQPSLTTIFNKFLSDNTISGLYSSKYDIENYKGKINFHLLNFVVNNQPKFRLKNAKKITECYNAITDGKKYKYNTIRIALKYLDYSYTRKRKIHIASMNIGNFKRKLVFSYEIHKLLINNHTIINIDETSLSSYMRICKDWNHKYSRNLYSNDKRIKPLSAIVAISTKGFVYSECHEKTIKSDTFREFLFNLMDKINENPFLKAQLLEKKITLFLDNSSVHKDIETLRDFTNLGFTFLFNVPYTPRFAYIEEVFSLVKRRMLYDNIVSTNNRIESFTRHLYELSEEKISNCFADTLYSIIEEMKKFSNEINS